MVNGEQVERVDTTEMDEEQRELTQEIQKELKLQRRMKEKNCHQNTGAMYHLRKIRTSGTGVAFFF